MERYLGLISGTSADGIDAALVEFAGNAPRLLAASSFAYPPLIRQQLLALSRSEARTPLGELAQLDASVGTLFAGAVHALCRQHGYALETVLAIGSHGQTLQHGAHEDPPWTMQIGDPNRIVENCGITTVADFRRRDMAAGGQGAPLLPAFHQLCLGSDVDAVLNIGGIANLSLLERGASPLLGFDCGPGSGLMDAWIARHLGDQFDRDGRWASQADPDAALLQRLLEHPFLRAPAPKSTGRETFSLDWLLSLKEITGLRSVVVQSTLCEFTARSIAMALLASRPDCRQLRVCGGGVHNGELMRRIRRELPAVNVESTAGSGVDPDWMEAMAFAWLARETLNARPGNAPSVTGAAGPRILGAIYRA